MEALRALVSLPDWEELLGSEAMVKSVSEVLQGEGIPIVKREETDEDVEILDNTICTYYSFSSYLRPQWLLGPSLF